MEIADYIIELLHKQKTAVVPGLGSFHTSRVEGYYNKEQQQFYPPSLQAQFSTDEQPGTDLADLIAEDRQISAASARYFIEKFVTSLKETVTSQNVPLGNMGMFSAKRGELHFEPNSLNESYELFYGLAPVKLKRGNAFKQDVVDAPAPRSPFFEKPRVIEPPKPIPAEEPAAPAMPEPHIATPAVDTVYIPETTPEEVEEQVEIEETEKRGINIWLLLAIIIVFLGVGVIALYKYNPELFSRFIAQPTKPAPPKPLIKHSLTDSANAVLQAQHDSAATTPDTLAPKQLSPATVPTTAAIDTFGIVVASERSEKLAVIDQQRYRKMGYPQAEVRRKPRSTKIYQVSIGTYFNPDSAKANMMKIRKERGWEPKDIFVQTYPYKKQ
jgi:hypothetical protein